jgi:menaquinone-dependent protoporphyrinogen oxidase
MTTREPPAPSTTRPRALIVFATKHGGTEGIADVAAETLRERGIDTDAWPAQDVRDIDPYDAVIVGSGVYMFRWLGDAVDFLHRFERELATRPTWLFSSGPTGGDSAADAKVAEIVAAQPPPPKNVAKLAARIGVAGHHTFGGRVDPATGGLFERWMPKGDWRDFDAVRTWANELADVIAVLVPQPTR